MSLLALLLTVAYWALIVWIILSYVVGFGRLPWGHPVRRVFDGLASVINPVLAPIRRVLPPLRLGGMALDLSPLVLFFAIAILRNLVA
ncbi:MAG: YggT family protein [Acidimicrobiia bacterium]|nr:YggT family protein [Acidimicrobiia bacterium]